ncbi:hypothetical protein A9Q84_11100 [Halobacteriovorax marinus]|uniref:Uncharacterized protein n=1 Tax=Halobacteriovorax marinus TaxID=97084 RepID=A0A1Y5F7I3_9BACT|nr:hypothetical protein A9Q84_11100 [Halobacteriovorax marinus]
MKKILLVLSLISLSLMAFYYLNADHEDMIEEDVKSPIEKSVPSAKTETVKTIPVPSKAVVSDNSVDAKSFEKYIDAVEEDWNKNIDDLFLEEAETAQHFIAEYKKLKNGYEAERERRYEKFHRMMEEKHGPNYSYSPSVDEEMYNEKLVKAYELSLSKIIGVEKMRKYMQVKDNFNRKLEDTAKNSKDGSDSFLLIEF